MRHTYDFLTKGQEKNAQREFERQRPTGKSMKTIKQEKGRKKNRTNKDGKTKNKHRYIVNKPARSGQ